MYFVFAKKPSGYKESFKLTQNLNMQKVLNLKQFSRLFISMSNNWIAKMSTFVIISVEFKNYHEFWSIDAFIECHELDIACKIKKHSFVFSSFCLSLRWQEIYIKLRKKSNNKIDQLFLLHYYFLTLSIDCSNFDAFIIKMKLKYIFS